MDELKKSYYVTFGIAGLIFSCFLISGLVYVWFVRQWNEVQSKGFLNDATRQRRSAIIQQFRGDLQVLRGVATSLSEMDLSDGERVYKILNAVNRGNDFVRMGMADLNGKAELYDLDGRIYRDVNLSERDFFHRAASGGDAASETFFDDLTSEYVNYYAVPVFKNGKVAKVLCAVNSEDVLREIIAVPVFRGRGYFAVVDKNGFLVAPSIDPYPTVDLGTNIFEIAEFSRSEQVRFGEALAGNLAGSFDFAVGMNRQLVTLLPLGINNWFVISVVPRNALNAYFNRTAVGITMLLLSASAVFLFLMYRQFSMMSKNRTKLAYWAYTDLLTGTRNYTKFKIDAEEALKNYPERKYAVWSFDIKDFSRINELYGNDIGNLVIKYVADLFSANEQKEEVFCHNSGDQFTGLFFYEHKKDIVRWFAEFFETLYECSVIVECRMHVDAAVGIYCIEDFEEAVSIDDMVNRASVAKKAAKEMVGSEVRFFSHEMGESSRRQTHLEAAGKIAIDQEEITFFLQPKISIQDGYCIHGAETLARWQHPLYGWIPPVEFIPLFERNGFIIKLDRAIFRQACKWYAKWLKGGNPSIKVAINVSRQGILQNDFVEHYIATKQEYEIDDGVLELEFTESVVLNDYRLFQNIILELQRNGFICSIDDFGAGYSSLNVLKNLPINILKLDAIFFRDNDDIERSRIVIANFIEMAKKLRIRTVAEGVETKEQVEFLKAAGCDVIQGYVFSKPLSQEDFKVFMASLDGEVAVAGKISSTPYELES